MTLRDIGLWLETLLDRVRDDLEIVFSSSPLDWPLWVFAAGFIVIFVIAPVLIVKIIQGAQDYIWHEPPMGLGWCIGFTVGAVLCTLVLVDLYVSEIIFNELNPAPMFLYIGYPIMTVFFAFFAFSEWRKHLRIRRGRR
jgi:hypothetical protein